MVNGLVYPSVEELIEFNVLSLAIIRAKKADSHGVLSNAKIAEAIGECRNAEGDVYLKAAVLLRALVKKHAFASGNRRTAFIAAKSFVVSNNGAFKVSDDPEAANAMRGVRENQYSDEELREWIKDGKIRAFSRQV
ncbi:MAG: type II toxin-antitoxin system death-on-curing family toxin [Candidatus Micrarchaeia archaeon]|jgi:death-on-curing protein